MRRLGLTFVHNTLLILCVNQIPNENILYVEHRDHRSVLCGDPNGKGMQRRGDVCTHMEKETATHSSIPAWGILWMEEPGGLHSMGLQRVGHS